VDSVPGLTDSEFVELCRQYEDYRLEVSADGELIIMPPAFSETSFQNGEISGQLRDWAKMDRRGRVFDSSVGCVLANGARRSPDASWISRIKIDAQPKEHRRGFFHLCPEFVVELRWTADGLRPCRQKQPQRIDQPTQVEGEGPVAGFVLDLTEIWA